jgi:Bacterial alpha-L-rhamnosidase 6 hairpin glycosidase domain/Bacterial alpha-L-rhamnosidase C-terminal domain
VARVLKETGSVREYWLEPATGEIAPVRLAATDLSGRRRDSVPYEPEAGLEICATASARRGVLIDFGKEVGGFPRLSFGPGACRRVGVQAVESELHLVNPLAAEPASLAEPGFYHHTFRASGDLGVRLPHAGGFRYLWLYPLSRGRAELREVSLDYTPHRSDPDSCGYFLSSDEDLNRAWFAGLHTVEMCTIDPRLGGAAGKHTIGDGKWVLVDGAKRDRLIWTGDLGPMGPAVFVSYNNAGAVRDSLLALASHQQKNGYIPACSPGPLALRAASGLFGEYVAWWVVCLFQYYIHTGDVRTVEESFAAVKRALHYLHSQCRGGLFRQTPLNMMEWCFTVLRRGRPSHTNAMYYWALNSAAYLANEIGEDAVSAGYVSRAFRLGEALKSRLWDSGRGAFVDTTADRKRVPQDANSIAIVSGMLSEPEDSLSILEYLAENNWERWGSVNVDIPYFRLTPGIPWHNRRVIPFMNNYEALARFIARDDDSAVELIRRCWCTMLDGGPGTFWEWKGREGEVPDRFTSLCHGWSAGVVPLLSKFVLGLRPAAPGYGRFVFDPRPCGLEWVEGRVPVPGGFIEARLERKKDGSYAQSVRAPSSTARVGSRA